MKTFYVTEKTDLKNFTDAVYPQGSFCFAALLRAKDIKINGVRVNKNTPLCGGEQVVYYTSYNQEAMPSHNAVYEDENIYVADKFSGVSSEGLLSELNGGGQFYAVHRLDRNTQGLIVFAKNKQSEKLLLQAFRDRKVQKTYSALCKNSFKKPHAVLTAYLEKDEKASAVKIYDRENKNAVKIVTEYKVAAEYGDIALVEVVLHTGKTHQIRAHLAHIGCPVLGDGKYGDKALNKKYCLTRQQLISKSLTFDADGILAYLKGKKFISSLNFSISP